MDTIYNAAVPDVTQKMQQAVSQSNGNQPGKHRRHPRFLPEAAAQAMITAERPDLDRESRWP